MSPQAFDVGTHTDDSPKCPYQFPEEKLWGSQPLGELGAGGSLDPIPNFFPFSIDMILRKCEKILEPFIKNPVYFNQLRTTYVVKRKYPAPLPSLTRQPSLRNRHHVYETVENNNYKPQLLSIILKKYVDDLGMAGEVVKVKESVARFLILSKSADYVTSDAQASSVESESFSSRYAASTLKKLSQFVLNISLNKESPWTLEPWHIRSAFRKAHVHVPESALTLLTPTPLSGPDMELEGKEFYVRVRINGRSNEEVVVRCRLHHWATKKEDRVKPVRDHWKFPAPLVFPTDEELNKSLGEIVPPVLVEDEGPKCLNRVHSTSSVTTRRKR